MPLNLPAAAAPRLTSLRTRLLAWLILPLLFLSAAHLYITFDDTRRTSEQIFDKLLTTLALSISEHALSTGGDLLTDDVLELIRATTNDHLYYKVIGPDAAFVMGYEDIPEPAGGLEVLDGHIQFYDAEYFDQDVRVIAVSSLVDRNGFSGWTTTFVAQTINDRLDLVWSTVRSSLVSVLALIVTTVLLLSFGINRGLAPLVRLEAALHRREPNDLAPIADDGTAYPREIQTLVGALNRLLGRLDQHVSLTKRFVENAAHELRTPVAALLPQSELALRNAETEREERAVGRIKQSAEKIARLTHQLLNLTYAESTQLEVQNRRPLDLAELVYEQVAAFREQQGTVQPHPTLHLEILPATVAGSPVSIGEIINNLLDNARLHAQASNVWVSTQRTAEGAELTVEDDGSGVAADDLARITERFYRVDRSRTGSGLGLSIVVEIMEAHGGHCDVGASGRGGLSVTCLFPQPENQLPISARAGS